jgi:hypothetical protein
VFGTSYNDQIVDTTILAGDGETVAIGGLIQKSDKKNENKVPWLGDLPYIGAAFRYRTQDKTKSELIIILTPHIVRSRADADRILAEEARRMDWIVGDVVKTHGTTGLSPILPPPPGEGTIIHGGESLAPPASAPSVEILPERPPHEALPQPRKIPESTPQIAPSGLPIMPAPASYAPGAATGGTTQPGIAALSGEPAPATSTEPAKEKSRLWKLFGK